MKNLLALLLLCFPAALVGQSLGVNIRNPHPSSVLDVTSNNKGLLIPRVALVDVTNSTAPVNNPATGLMVYNTNASVVGGNGTGFYYFNGSQWDKLVTQAANVIDTDDQTLSLSGTDLSIADGNTVDLSSIVPTASTLDGAYDAGGAGAGRTINATDGAVQIGGTDGFIVTGTITAGADVPVTGGAGVRMFFNPKTAAFRSGKVNGSQWDQANLGNYSFGAGFNATASGNFSTATGDNTIASGRYTFATGRRSTASADYAVALGATTSASANAAFAAGNVTMASGSVSTAMGNSTTASGNHSTAMGNFTIASGTASTALGHVTTAESFAQTTLGTYNTEVTPHSSTGFHEADRLLVVGNGSTSNTRSDALVILKNGNTGIGESNPDSTLHVKGGFKLEDGNQQAGYVLTSDANGGATWQAPNTLTLNTLDGAYDEGGAGIGRTINATDGAVEINGTDGLLITGTHGNGADITTSGSGTRMFFNPKKSAFRAGYAHTNTWDVDSVGDYSVAMGFGTKAKGLYATAFGAFSEANGDLSTAIGRSNIASGSRSIAMGVYTSSESYGQVSLGVFNTEVTPNSATAIDANDRLLVVGNGTSVNNRSDALVVLKNGNIGMGTSVPAEKLHVTGNILSDGGRIPVINTGNSIFIGEGAGENDDFTNNDNVGIGYNALQNNVGGFQNCAIGESALIKNISGNENTALGVTSMANNTTGHRNVAVGDAALVSIVSGHSNTALGYAANVGAGTLNYSTAIGAYSRVNCDDCLVLGRTQAKVGVGTSAPAEKLHVSNGNLMVTGTLGSGDDVAINGNGTRMFFNPKEGAIRAGYAISTHWDADSIGRCSAAFGASTKATGTNATAMGKNTIARGTSSTAMGQGSIANSIYSTAMGRSTEAKGVASTAIGLLTQAESYGQVSLGIFNTIVTPIGSSHYNSNDRLLVVGNGDGYNSRSDALTILKNGNTGIGTSNPHHLLDLGSNVGKKLAIFQNATGTDFYGLGANNNNLELHAGAIDASSAPIMVINKNGNLGIGTTNPTKGKLEVSGVGNSITHTIAYFNRLAHTGVYNATWAYSIYATGAISGQEFHAHSDERIKNIHGVSNSTNDLNTLMDIEITDYNLVDSIGRSSKPYKKVIAQQVKEVYPQAVTDNTTEVVPDIYQLADVQGGWIVLNNRGLKVGERIKIIGETAIEIVEITEVEGNRFKTSNQQLVTSNQQLFIYGREVNDFHTVDYEAISMLNVSATQELAKRMIQLEQENRTLKAGLSENRARLDKIEAQLGAGVQTKK